MATSTPLHLTTTPRLPLAALGVLVLVTLMGVAVVRWLGVGGGGEPTAPVLQARSLHFDDLPDGGIAVRDAASGQVLQTVAPGTNGFLRSAVRGLVRERKRQQLGPEVPFLLLARSDGRLTLQDPGTGRRIDLEAFGPVNAGVFVRLLPGPPTP
ncbi:photosynthetic complex assembly protein PuhC [Aquincola tertiaricarbonis]|uniref:Photosynthetic complex assembly protein PuhC n=1 Tax=Aquincola tertiaricarbonis TaxID=391953 RepID=A0ABY4S6L2_AQUTE|nr:photosynthetic complex assembly protein PuhC [Aquincola tertiaricarbonis]URI07556.1 photosynthetic complex assembly protein PuhC [Aquincola tertiaricarbonis]